MIKQGDLQRSPQPYLPDIPDYDKSDPGKYLNSIRDTSEYRYQWRIRASGVNGASATRINTTDPSSRLLLYTTYSSSSDDMEIGEKNVRKLGEKVIRPLKEE